MMPLIEYLIVIGQTWTGATATLLAVVVLFTVRRLLPAELRTHGAISLWFLWLALGFGVSATAALKLGAYTVWEILSFLDLLSLVCGLTGLAGLIIFDFLLNNLHIRVPAILRDLIHLSIIMLIVLTILYQRG